MIVEKAYIGFLDNFSKTVDIVTAVRNGLCQLFRRDIFVCAGRMLQYTIRISVRQSEIKYFSVTAVGCHHYVGRFQIAVYYLLAVYITTLFACLCLDYFCQPNPFVWDVAFRDTLAGGAGIEPAYVNLPTTTV